MAVETITSSALRAMSDVDFDKLIAQLSTCSTKKYGAKAKVQPRIEKRPPAQLFDISDYADDASKITMKQQFQQANWSDIQAVINADLRATQIGDAVFVDIHSGTKFGNRHINNIIANMQEELGLYKHYLSEDTLKLFNDYIDDFQALLKRGTKQFSHIDASTLNRMSVDSVKKAIMQEIESNRQQFKDHGIRHIMNNIKRQKELLGLLEKSGFDVSSMDYLQGQFIMINHDVGYATPLTRAGGLRGVNISRKHPVFSTKILREQKELWDVGKVFSEEEYKRILRLVATHDGAGLPMTDPLAVATRLADNLGLYSSEKLPGMFRYVENGEDLLVKLGLASKNKDKVLFRKIKKELEEAIDKTARFSAQLKRDLKAGIQQIDYTTPKFTLGVLGGDMEKMYSTAKSWLVIEVRHNEFDQFLARMFDMGQDQLKKLMDKYGASFVDDVLSVGKYKGKNILEIRILDRPVDNIFSDLDKVINKNDIDFFLRDLRAFESDGTIGNLRANSNQIHQQFEDYMISKHGERQLDFASNMLQSWASSSTGNNANVMKYIMGKRKKLPAVRWDDRILDKDEYLLKEYEKKIEQVLKLTSKEFGEISVEEMSTILDEVRQYNKFILKKFYGNKKITLYRGTRRGLDDKGILRNDILSSWTTDITVARRFGNKVIKIEVDVDDIFANYSGMQDWFHSITEKEYILMDRIGGYTYELVK